MKRRPTAPRPGGPYNAEDPGVKALREWLLSSRIVRTDNQENNAIINWLRRPLNETKR